MQQNQLPILVLAGFLIFLIYQEINLIKMFLFYRKNGKLAFAEIINTIQLHDSNLIYKVKIKNLNLDYSKHRIKITLLSSFFPKFLSRDFKVYFLDDSDYCIVATPMMIILDWILIFLIFILVFTLI